MHFLKKLYKYIYTYLGRDQDNHHSSRPEDFRDKNFLSQKASGLDRTNLNTPTNKIAYLKHSNFFQYNYNIIGQLFFNSHHLYFESKG